MHIPEGFLTGPAVAAGAVVAAAGLAVCLRRSSAEARERDLPVAGLAAAFFLVADAPLFPVGVGTQGHLLGGTLAVVLLGPWLGALTIAVVTMIQAFALGDGGITPLGVAIVNLAFVPALVGYPLVLALRRVLPRSRAGLAAACGIAAWTSVVVASVLFALEVSVGGPVELDRTALAATTIGTYAVIGIIEGVVTALIVRGLLGLRPDLLRVAGPEHRAPRRRREPAEAPA